LESKKTIFQALLQESPAFKKLRKSEIYQKISVIPQTISDILTRSESSTPTTATDAGTNQGAQSANNKPTLSLEEHLQQNQQLQLKKKSVRHLFLVALCEYLQQRETKVLEVQRSSLTGSWTITINIARPNETVKALLGKMNKVLSEENKAANDDETSQSPESEMNVLNSEASAESEMELHSDCSIRSGSIEVGEDEISAKLEVFFSANDGSEEQA